MGIDGRIARLTNTQSAFGAEYDSLSDMVSFGIGPALVIYQWGLVGMGKLGWLAAFFYAAATALRLARFNTQVETADKKYFQGLPCPLAAAVVAGLVWFSTDYGLTGAQMMPAAFAVTIIVGSLMVSNVRYYSFKELRPQRPCALHHDSRGGAGVRAGVQRSTPGVVCLVHPLRDLRTGVDPGVHPPAPGRTARRSRQVGTTRGG